MIYKNFKGKRLSSLGLGCMRLPTLGSYERIDAELTKKMVKYAMDNGINYYDTAWGYHSGNSESVMGEILSEYPRDSFYLASKFPGFDTSNMEKVEEIFESQLKKCKVDHFDFYLFHSVSEGNVDLYLDRKYGIFEYLCEQKKRGRIHHLGFSTHGTLETVKRFMDAYGSEIEFCQIQLNWLDWSYQDAKAKVEYLNSLNLPIWVMEPVRGGRLCALAPKYENVLRSLAPERKNPEWAFRYLQSVEGVTVTLSGMSSFEQLCENIETFKTEKPLNDREMQTLYDIAEEMTRKNALPCTSCRYCTEKCPVGLDIPKLIEVYNENTYTDGGFISSAELEGIDADRMPSACLCCRACEEVCPQGIKISEMMSDMASRLK